MNIKDRQRIVDFVLERIIQAKKWKHVQEKDLKTWIRDECELRHFDAEKSNAVIDELLNEPR